MLVPAPALLVLGGRPDDIPPTAPQHDCVQNMSEVDRNVPSCLSLHFFNLGVEKCGIIRTKYWTISQVFFYRHLSTVHQKRFFFKIN